MKISKSLKMFLKAMFLQAGKVATDKGELIYEGDELVEGAEVFIEKVDEEGNTELVPAEDGEYIAEDKVIVVAEGKVSEIRDKENGGGNADGEGGEGDNGEGGEPANGGEGGEGGEPASQESQEPNAEPANEEPDNNEESAEEKIARLEQNLAGALESIEGLTNRVAALEGKLAELEKPAADPAETEQPKEEVERTIKK